MRKKLFLIPLFISLFLLGACSNNSTSQNSESSSNSSSVKTSKLVNGDIAFITGENNGMYEIEIRTQSPGSTAVTNLKGIYHYNPTTGSIQKIDPTTGVFN